MRIETERVTLAPFCVWDAGLWLALARDPAVRAHLGGVQTIRQQSRGFRRDLRGGRMGVVGCVRAGARKIGLIYLTPTRDPGTFEISYLFRPAVWGRGLATEAVSAVLQSKKQHAPDVTIVAETQSANLRSRRLLERQGFAETARLTRFGTEQVRYEWTGGPRACRVST